MVPSEVVVSPETQLQYRIERMLGEGGFGQVFLATRLGRSAVVPEIVCIKVSARIDGWLREAYFGQLLDGHPRAIRVFDTFPLVRPGGEVLYCLTLEYARHGDLSAFLSRAGKGWNETTAIATSHRSTSSSATAAISSSETSASCVSKAINAGSPHTR
ncbi:MAG: hypothetical protein AUF76_08720 [Acidobacteria bacterium 13_1_20CM_2_65_9]|nr:MAG: hypothetical protein AUF76_08720 [Acidobacteria bacterium 13_1_20CM_2_65_9]